MCRSSSPRRTRSRPGLRYKNLVNTSHQHIQNTLMKLKSKGWMSNWSGECRLIKLVDTWDINCCPRTISIAIFQQHQQKFCPMFMFHSEKSDEDTPWSRLSLQSYSCTSPDIGGKNHAEKNHENPGRTVDRSTHLGCNEQIRQGKAILSNFCATKNCYETTEPSCWCPHIHIIYILYTYHIHIIWYYM